MKNTPHTINDINHMIYLDFITYTDVIFNRMKKEQQNSNNSQHLPEIEGAMGPLEDLENSEW